MIKKYKKRTPEERIRLFKMRFWSKVDIGDEDECWEWKGYIGTDGYGRISEENKYKQAHRVAWRLANKKKIPKGMCVCHHCDNPSCCNPKHLFLGTNRDNSNDMVSKMRQSFLSGENHGSAKLTDKEVYRIRRLYKTKIFTQKELAEHFRITQSQISRIINKNRRRN